MTVGELICALEQYPEYRNVDLQVETEDDVTGMPCTEHYPMTAVFERQVQGSGNVTVVIR